MEKWNDVLGYEGFYEVSTLGRVRSKTRIVKSAIKNNETVIKKGKTLKLSLKHTGYYSFDASKEGLTKTKTVHREVAKAFIPNPYNKPCINHKNAIKTDNRVENLEWCTYKENSQHASKMELYPAPQKKTLLCLEEDIVFESSVKAANWLNKTLYNGTKNIKTVSKNIRRASTGGRVKAYGYTWKDLN